MSAETTPDNALDLLLHWPLVLVILDGYEPSLAKTVIATISEQSEETITLLWDFTADRARENSHWN